MINLQDSFINKQKDYDKRIYITKDGDPDGLV